ncbi:response regulator transcription factor [Mucilaginibacter jinjuensis]|uniref:Response regulator n=1 Tax=Mucilaginibacter jinjuensis TaxID=1176721 RepID=A0ABY7T7T4_9SPHI|nr:response regulator [Mucilaginibacter jinjuensis]WCT12466.1 response regulator [Mucilaginibacter jinjuensis]
MLKKILIADDDPGIVDAVEMMLSFSGYDVSSTYDGRDALKLSKEQLPDLFLLDIWMSGVDGRDICRELKEKVETRQIPVLMISASNDIHNSAIDAGADDFMTKPFDMQQLIDKIDSLLKKEAVAVGVN